MKHIKKILFSILFIQIISSSILMYLGHFQYISVLDMTIKEKERTSAYMIENLFDKITKDCTSYADRILSSPDIIDAFAKGDRQKVYQLTLPYYETLQHVNPFLDLIHFHTTDTHSFLRMHKPDKFGDDISDFRQIIVKTNYEKTMQSGIETGKYGIFYRVAFPVFKEKDHIGSLEFGIDIKYLISKLEMQNILTPLIILRKEAIEPFYKYNKEIDSYLDNLTEKYAFVKYVPQVKNTIYSSDIIDDRITKEKSYIVDKDNAKYLVFKSYDFKDYAKNQIGFFVFIEEMDYYINTIVYLRWLSIITTILLFLLTILLIYRLIKNHTKSLIINEAKLSTLNNTLTSVIEGANLGYWDWNMKYDTYYVNDRWLRILGLSRDDISGNTSDWRERVHPSDIGIIHLKIEKAVEDCGSYSGEFRMLHKDGHYVWIEESGSVVERDENGIPVRLCGTHQDITSRKELHEKLEKLAITDALTQLNNRRHFNDIFKKEIKQARRDKRELTFLMIDIDHFKNYNDNYGHDAGDKVLKKISTTMKSFFKRPNDNLFRIGGEEFGVIFTDLSLDESIAYSQKLIEKVEELAIENRGNPPFNVHTISIGLCHVNFKTENYDFTKLYHSADEALYKAKANGRNQVKWFSEEF